MPDYSSQLHDIVAALNRPSIRTWLVAVISAMLGFLGSVASQFLQQVYGELRSRARLRLIVYSELGSIYSAMTQVYKLFASLPSDEAIARKKSFLQNKLSDLDGEKYIKDHPEVFHQLRERAVIRDLYSWSAELIGPDDELGFDIRAGLAIEIFEDMVRLGELPRKYVERYMGLADVQKLDKANHERLAQGQATVPSKKKHR